MIGLTKTARAAALVALAVAAMTAQASSKALALWYSTPAATWNEALPIGNGRVAAMVYGNPVCEEIQMNEETISNGSPYSNYNPDTPKYLDNLRQLIFSGRSDSAQVLAETQLMGPRVYGKGGAVCRPVPCGLGGASNLRYPGGARADDRWNGSTLVSADADGGEEIRCPVLNRICTWTV